MAVLPEEVDEVDGAGLVGVEGVLELDGRVGEVEDGGGVVDGGDLAAFVLPVGFQHALYGALLLEAQVLF